MGCTEQEALAVQDTKSGLRAIYALLKNCVVLQADSEEEACIET
jgi:hypothetical protein